MLTKPKSGWTVFSLEGIGEYYLSYLDDIAFEWLEQAVHGLETMLPFCVKGFLEPGRMLCTVSYWNCHIVIENDERQALKNICNKYSHTSMLEFCRYLYNDISGCTDEWASFADYTGEDTQAKNDRLLQMLNRLKQLISDREEWFGEDRCFL